MSIKSLKKYIEDIDNRRTIHLTKFITLIEMFSLPHQYMSTDIDARKIKGTQYQVERVNEHLMALLRHLVNDGGTDRISAARQNRSHSHKVKGSLFLIRKRDAHPNVVIIDEAGHFQYPKKISKKALVVENRQNFIYTKRTLTFLEKYTQFESEQDIDVIFGEGNEISNSLHKQFLTQYEHLYLFLDLDLGGLITARNLISLLPKTPIEFLIPADIESRLKNVTEISDVGYIQKVIDIGSACPPLAPFAKLIKEHRCTLEQESYLNDE